MRVCIRGKEHDYDGDTTLRRITPGCGYSPILSGAVIACSILKDLEGIALPMYFFGSRTCCSLGGRFACVSSETFQF